MQHIKLIIPKTINNIKDGEINKDFIIRKSEEIIKKSAFNIKVLFYNNKTLGIKTLDSIIANEIYLNQEKLKEKINEFFKKEIVDKIIIKN